MRQHATEKRDQLTLQALTLYAQARRAAKRAPDGNLAIGPWRSEWHPAEGGKSHVRLILAGELSEAQFVRLALAFAGGNQAILRAELVSGETTLHFLAQTGAPLVEIPVYEGTDAAGDPIRVIPQLQPVTSRCRKLNPEAWADGIAYAAHRGC